MKGNEYTNVSASADKPQQPNGGKEGGRKAPSPTTLLRINPACNTLQHRVHFSPHLASDLKAPTPGGIEARA